ncbi:extracellular solute-binding protein [Streptomyces sp. NPDC006879]|uniref:extracellular solute-binding protein n=1 Tax=Streptomyces sp. NPDC006879 TaxID=3364767 RepID=UPI0036B518A3
MQRRLFSATAPVLALGLVATLTGCGTTTGSDGPTLRLVAAEYGDREANSSRAFWDARTAEFTEAHPEIRVDVELLPWEDIDREVTKMVDEGDAPDLALMGAYSDFAADGQLYEAGELLPIAAEANFLGPLADAGSVNGRLYGLPFVASSRLLFYNEELLEAAGVRPPETWSQLESAARALGRQGVKYPFALPLGPEEAHAEAMIWALSNGGGYADGSGGYRIDSESNVDTFRWLQDKLVARGLTGPVPPAELNRQDAFDAFLRGEVGMLNGYPSLAHEARRRGIELGTSAMPVADRLADEDAPPTMGVADWMMAFKANGHRREAGAFLDFLYRDDNLREFADRYGLLPSTISAARSSGTSEHALDSVDAQFLTALNNAELYPVNKRSWVKASDTIKHNIGRAVDPAADSKTVLEEISKAISEAEGD